MRKTRSLIATACALLASMAFASALPAHANTPHTLYVDCSISSPGNGERSFPWNSLDSVDLSRLTPGTTLAFRSGTTCTGSLTITQSGSSTQPITLTSWGDGAKPILHGGGTSTSSAPLILHNASHIHVDGLEFTGGYWQNLLATAGKDTQVTDLAFTHLTLHDNAWVPPFAGWIVGTGGLVVQPCSISGRIDGLLIDDVQTYSHNESGIQVGYTNLQKYDPANEVGAHNAPTCYMDDRGNAQPPRNGVTNVTIKNVDAHHNAASGLQVFGATDVLIENNELHHNGGGAGMNGEGAWWSNTFRVLAQYNNAYSNIRGRTGDDGSGLDADYMTDDNIIQYNYLSNNEGYGVSLIAGDGPSNNSIVRYNVMTNNGTGNIGAPDIMISRADDKGTINGALVYNNTLMRNGGGQGIRLQVPLSGSLPNEFRNNLIYREGSSEFISTTNNGVTLSHNLYFTTQGSATVRYNNVSYRSLDSIRRWTRQEQGSLYANPYIVDWNYAGTHKPQPSTFTLKPMSPAIGGGHAMPLPAHGDYYGNPFPSDRTDIGAIWAR